MTEQSERSIQTVTMCAVAVLVVDDYQPFCRLIGTVLETTAFRVAGHAYDGSEAVRKASDLQPNLVLLDIGLPQLNGIEAAKRIRKVAPHSKILFVSQETSSEIVEAALSSGGLGYVYKSRIENDLVPAIESVLAGRRYVSHEREVRLLTEETNAQSLVRHEVLFYSEDATLIESVAAFIARALKTDNPAIVVATESHREGFARRLTQEGIDVKGAIQKGLYIACDAAEVLTRLTVNDSFDSARFISDVTRVIESASNVTNKRRPQIAVFGEGVSLLCAKGNTNEARYVEKLWNALLKAHENVELLCAYQLRAFGDAPQDAFEAICKEHSAVRAQ